MSAFGAYGRVDEVAAATQFGNCGPPGWGFTLWCAEHCDDDNLHRSTLERFAAARPEASLSLPPPEPCEDCIEGSLLWRGQPVWVWYETILCHLRLWSSDRSTLVELREALLPFAPVKAD